MQKKLSEEKHREILECGISEFAAKGLRNACMSDIASSAGTSVGVLYKYYEDKETFFFACLHRGLSVLEELFSSIYSEGVSVEEYMRRLIKAAQSLSREYPDYLKMYHKITCMDEFSDTLANEIEGLSSRLYTELFSKAQSRGELRSDISPALLAFFFDNILMMLQFSYSCPYYMERYCLYDENLPDNDELVADGFLELLKSALLLQ